MGVSCFRTRPQFCRAVKSISCIKQYPTMSLMYALLILTACDPSFVVSGPASLQMVLMS